MLSEYLVEGGKPGVDSDKRLQGRLRALAEALVPGAAVGVGSVSTWQEKVIFEYWRVTMGKGHTVKFGNDRRQKVRARLREGYTVEQIKRAIDGCAGSAFHRGENDGHREYNDLTLICQTSAKLEQFIEMGPPVSTVVRSSEDLEPDIERQRELVELQKQANEELKKGDTNAYNSTQARIRTLRRPTRVSSDRAGSHP
jgi:hypothetical protein